MKNLKEFWAYFNSQISSELKEFGSSQVRRMQDQVGDYINGFMKRVNTQMSIFIDLQTKIITETS